MKRNKTTGLLRTSWPRASKPPSPRPAPGRGGPAEGRCTPGVLPASSPDPPRKWANRSCGCVYIPCSASSKTSKQDARIDRQRVQSGLAAAAAASERCCSSEAKVRVRASQDLYPSARWMGSENHQSISQSCVGISSNAPTTITITVIVAAGAASAIEPRDWRPKGRSSTPSSADSTLPPRHSARVCATDAHVFSFSFAFS